MKTAIHPAYYSSAKIRCVCGNSAVAGSTVEDISVELCSKCHPFYTGKQKLIDTAGRVEKFQKKAARKVEVAAERKGRQVKRARAVERKSVKIDKKKTAEQ